MEKAPEKNSATILRNANACWPQAINEKGVLKMEKFDMEAAPGVKATKPIKCACYWFWNQAYELQAVYGGMKLLEPNQRLSMRGLQGWLI